MKVATTDVLKAAKWVGLMGTSMAGSWALETAAKSVVCWADAKAVPLGWYSVVLWVASKVDRLGEYMAV